MRAVGTHAIARPLDLARRRLAQRVADMRVGLIPGLRDDLKAIDEAFAELDARTRLMASCLIGAVDPDVLEQLAQFARP